ncbi:MAG: hypothetical protein H6940_11825 [Burkholderiales bacterium]|uniref:hypothetical protein n=1 Tax=Nitrosomonas sp. TaxID=42353 RepID=UPI001D60DB01|nr:hypothetical protein [Nitrosomonas sp.]MCB1949976.1 hypothetical protein [Nitrosomonas sp.]MCP5244097.1 hypothetical protein [Burkholderiales bacterium]
MSHSTEAALVFADLKDAFDALNDARTSPKDVRRAFSRFIELSQKLTSAMRRDASRLEKGKWAASSFTGWTPVTELMKYLRNEDQHRDQIFLSVHERRHFPIPTNLPPGFNVEPGRTFVFEGTWVLSDQLLDAPPEGITTHEIDPLTGKPTGREMELLKIERYYILQARSEEAKEKIKAAGTVDVHRLAASAFSTLAKYFEFFCAQTDT